MQTRELKNDNLKTFPFVDIKNMTITTTKLTTTTMVLCAVLLESPLKHVGWNAGKMRSKFHLNRRYLLQSEFVPTSFAHEAPFSSLAD